MGARTSITDENLSALQVVQVERVSVASDGTEGDGPSTFPSISAHGRYVAYESYAHTLAPDDPNFGNTDIFLFDRQTGTTTRVTDADGFSHLPSISADGSQVAYFTVTPTIRNDHFDPVYDSFVFDRNTGTTTLVPVESNDIAQNSYDDDPSISADGRHVAYESYSQNLVPGDTNGSSDIFVLDRQSNTTERVSVASNGTESNFDSTNPSISADGRFVTYQSSASTLISGDDNGALDVFVFDRQTNINERVSVASGGAEANGSSSAGAISADGRFVTYTSDASNLIPGDTNGASDVFVFDRQTQTTTRVSVASDGTEANGPSGSILDYGSNAAVSISADGRLVAYRSDASNLVPGDTNGVSDVFVFDRETNTTVRVSVAGDGTEANGPSAGVQEFGPSGGVSISADGRFVSFHSDASNLVAGDTNGVTDVFVVQLDVVPLVDGVVKDGDDGNNILKGTHRDDILRGHGGRDLLLGQKGDDRLDGGAGNDKIFAGKGDDTVLGGAGNDRIWTGKGSDLVVFNEGDGRDRICDFDHRRDVTECSFDRVQLDVSIGGNHIHDFAELEALIASGDIGLSTRHGSLTLTFDDGDALTLGGVHTLSAQDWLFA